MPPTPSTPEVAEALRLAMAQQYRLVAPSDHLTSPRHVTEKTKSVLHSVFRVAERHGEHLRNAARHQNPALSPDANLELRSLLLDSLQAQMRSVADDLEVPLNSAQYQADVDAAPFRPSLDPNDSAQLLRTDQAWRNSVLPQIEKGREWPRIISGLDVDGLLAVERFAPAHEASVRDEFHQHEVPVVLSQIKESINRRLPDAIPTPEGREAVGVAIDVGDMADIGRGWLQALGQATHRDIGSLWMGINRTGTHMGVNKPVATSEAPMRLPVMVTQGAAAAA